MWHIFHLIFDDEKRVSEDAWTQAVARWCLSFLSKNTLNRQGWTKSGLVRSRINITRIKRCDVLKRKKSSAFRPSLNLDDIHKLQVAWNNYFLSTIFSFKGQNESIVWPHRREAFCLSFNNALRGVTVRPKRSWKRLTIYWKYYGKICLFT